MVILRQREVSHRLLQQRWSNPCIPANRWRSRAAAPSQATVVQSSTAEFDDTTVAIQALKLDDEEINGDGAESEDSEDSREDDSDDKGNVAVQTAPLKAEGQAKAKGQAAPTPVNFSSWLKDFIPVSFACPSIAWKSPLTVSGCA